MPAEEEVCRDWELFPMVSDGVARARVYLCIGRLGVGAFRFQADRIVGEGY